MKVNTKNMISLSEANQNFSKVTRYVDEEGPIIVLKNNKPKYVVMEYCDFEYEAGSEEDDILEVSKRLIKKNLNAYKELAK